jgi:hypothetical protein
MYRFKKFAFLQCLDDRRFKCIFHKQFGSGFESGSEIKVKIASRAEKKQTKKLFRIHKTAFYLLM